MGKLAEYVRSRLTEAVGAAGVVVWYDAGRAFTDFVAALKLPACRIVTATASKLAARREADELYRTLRKTEDGAPSGMLIYLAQARGKTIDQQQSDPFEYLCAAGRAFGSDESEQLESMARQALPDRAEEIRRMFQEGKPTFGLLDGLEEASSYPVLGQLLGTENPSEVISLVVCDRKTVQRIEDRDGAMDEFLRLAEAEIGWKTRKKSMETIRPDLARYLLLSEFMFDGGAQKPAALDAVSIAENRYRERVFKVCERMRADSGLVKAYVEWAQRIQDELHLPELAPSLEALGSRDTFPFEEAAYLTRLVGLTKAGDLVEARKVLDERGGSIWRNLGERKLYWKTAERCLDFLSAASRLGGLVPKSAKLKELIDAYTGTDGGLSELDRLQRHFENSASGCMDHADIAGLAGVCRAKYVEVAGRLQTVFQRAVESQGWPAEGILRQGQVFDRFVAPSLQTREKTAYFLVDSLRFEMGRDLSAALRDAGEVTLEAVQSVLPAATPYGMAALMPAADGAMRLVRDGEDVVPQVGSRLLKNSGDRMTLLKKEFGARFDELKLDDLMSKPVEKFAKRFADVDFLVVRTPDPDEIAENLSNRQARKYMTDAIGEVAGAVRRLSTLGFRRFVLTADHGHMLVPEVEPGDHISPPAGDWTLRKRRCCVGASQSQSDDCLTLPAAKAGIQGDFAEICVPRGFKVFGACDGYFHEGLSLQECIVPVVSLRTAGRTEAVGERSVSIKYGKASFTSRVVGLTVNYMTIVGGPLRVLIQAYGEVAGTMQLVGEAADCPERDEATKHVLLSPQKEISVPVLIDADFAGADVEIRVSEPDSGLILDRLRLKNGMMM